jgi:hypothetical protein
MRNVWFVFLRPDGVVAVSMISSCSGIENRETLLIYCGVLSS